MFGSLCAQQIVWADEVLGFSSQRTEKLFSSREATGPPSRYPAAGFTTCAWMPSKNSDTVYIHLSFPEAVKAEELLLFQPFDPHLPDRIECLDGNGQLSGFAPIETEAANLYRINMDGVVVKEIRLMWYDPPGSMQLDAVGISGLRGSEITFPADTTYAHLLPEPVTILNSPYDEVMPLVDPKGTTIYFDRKGHPQNNGDERKDDIWYAVLQNDGKWSTPLPIGPPLNNEGHNYVNALDTSGNTLIVGNAYAADGPLCSITRTANGWTSPKGITIEGFSNDDRFNEFTISADGTVMVFAVERDDGFGLRDLYMVKRISENRYGQPVNLGDMVNTAGTEMSPFLARDKQTLYFAGDGHPGYGGMDLFMTRRLDGSWTNWSVPLNLGPAINTSGWEAYFTTGPRAEYAWYCSSGNGDNLDIYSSPLSELSRPDSTVPVVFRVVDRENGEAIEATLKFMKIVSEKDSLWQPEFVSVSDGTSRWQPDSRYMLVVDAEGYFNHVADIHMRDYDPDGTTIWVELIPKRQGASITLNDLYFRANSAILSDSSHSVLNELTDFLLAHPGVEMEVRGHTNGLCEEAFCLSLSERRAKAVVDYLEAGGVRPGRLLFSGKGKSEPVADNATPEGRQLNQRVEFVLLKVE